MKIWRYFDNPSFRIQLFIETLNKDIRREFARAPQAPLTLANAIEQAIRYENILSREKSRRSRREAATHQNVGGPAPATSHQPTYKRKREDKKVEARPPGNRPSAGPPKYRRQIDGTQTEQEEKKKIQIKERRCFVCNKKRHLSRDCRSRKDGKSLGKETSEEQ
ncbi:hypothetical protein BDW72DRAFT_10635 [Aspergillus terricola var. indicus]